MKKKKKSPKLLILYKNGTMLEISEKKLEPNYMKKAKYLLVPIDKKPNAYWCVRPSKMWFASRYIVDMQMDVCIVDFEESLYSNYGFVPSHFESTSLVAFVNFLCTLYKLNGYLNLAEQGTGDLNACLQMFTPSKIQVVALDDDKHIKYELVSPEIYHTEGYSDSATDVIFQLEKMGDILSDLLFGFDSAKDTINCIPQLIEVDFMRMEWAERKKITKCRYNGYKLFRIDDFGAYFLGSDDIWNRCMRARGMWLYIFGLGTNDAELLPKAIRNGVMQCDHVSPMNRQILSEACDNEEIDAYAVRYHMSIADPFAYLQWITFSEDIIAYVVLMTYIVENSIDESSVDISNIKVLIFGCNSESGAEFASPDSLMCSQSEALLGKIRQYLLDRIYKEEK